MAYNKIFQVIACNRYIPVLLVPLTSSLTLFLTIKIPSVLGYASYIPMFIYWYLLLIAIVVTVVIFLPVLWLFKIFRINLNYLLLVAALVSGIIYVKSPLYTMSIWAAYSCGSEPPCAADQDSIIKVFIKSSVLNPLFWTIIFSGIIGPLSFLYASKVQTKCKNALEKDNNP